MYENVKKAMEMKECTFQPQIDKKSDKLASVMRGTSSTKTFEAMHNKHSEKMDRAKKLLKDKEDKEREECTFKP